MDCSTQTGGGYLSVEASQASTDGLRIFVPRANEIHIFSLNTGERLLKFQAHSAPVTAVARDPKNSQQIYTASLDGTIKLWQFEDGNLANSLEVGQPVKKLVIPQKSNVAYIVCGSPGESNSKICTVSLKDLKLMSFTKAVDGTPEIEPSSVGNLVASFSKRRVFAWKTSTPLCNMLSLNHTKTITCCAVHPSEDCVAAGDSSGRILLWHGIEQAMQQQERRESPLTSLTTQHWHPSPVGCLCFSQDGHYLLSGGLETVLVIWQLSTGARNYLPRLGGALRSIRALPDPDTGPSSPRRPAARSGPAQGCARCSRRPGTWSSPARTRCSSSTTLSGTTTSESSRSRTAMRWRGSRLRRLPGPRTGAPPSRPTSR
uniref:NET1-associated nuclear protein 1 (U3 small nucleolar RNA-associated protein 17) n=1 Tax=Tetraselmis sp. GSL018 TaxID=582737 RepID=A0A061SNK5_9CHLO